MISSIEMAFLTELSNLLDKYGVVLDVYDDSITPVGLVKLDYESTRFSGELIPEGYDHVTLDAESVHDVLERKLNE